MIKENNEHEEMTDEEYKQAILNVSNLANLLTVQDDYDKAERKPEPNVTDKEFERYFKDADKSANEIYSEEVRGERPSTRVEELYDGLQMDAYEKNCFDLESYQPVAIEIENTEEDPRIKMEVCEYEAGL